MKIISLILIFSFLLCSSSFANEKVQKFDWNGVEVVWLQDQTFPTYDFVVYFADGALSDLVGGESDAMFNLLTFGTRRFEQKEISDNLDFYGVSRSSEVTHEYSVYHVSGLVKDLKPTMKMMCHLFSDATFPEQEVKRYKSIFQDRLNNMVNSPGALGTRAFRALSMAETPFAHPVQGMSRDIEKLSTKVLKDKLAYFNNKVFKKIYLTGPSSVLEMKDIITKECGWNQKANFKREVISKDKKIEKKPIIHLVTVPQTTQAYIYLGRYLNKNEIKNLEVLELLSNFLGGGFSSKLMQEIRVKRGLSYGAEAYAAGQRNYGRLVVSTYTKNESVFETLKVIQDTFAQVAKGDFSDKEFETTRDGLVGAYPFRFEKSMAYLDQLIYFDHIGRDYEEIYHFPKTVQKLSRKDLVNVSRELLDWKQLTITILGQKDLAEKLKEFGEVKVTPYSDYL